MTDALNIIGLDLSLRATGVASEGVANVLITSLPKNPTYMDEVRRLRLMSASVDSRCRGADLVVLENFAHGRHQRAHQLGELHGVVKVCLLQRGITFIPIPPAKLKQFACDHGGAPKEAVLAAAIRDGFPGHDHNAADAWWLRRMGLYAYRPDLRAALPKYRQQVLDGIRWPSIERKEVASA